MAKRPDKRNRKEALDRWKARQRASAGEKLPLPDSQMEELFRWLDAELSRRDCNHTLCLVQERCAQHHVAFESLEAWLHETGGFCDCEALANSERAWRDAIQDGNS
jgi:hypothetical protein